MNMTKSIQYILMFALAVALCLSFPMNQANAYTCPGPDTNTICFDGGLASCDSDDDGYTDAEECAGITLPDATNTGDATISMDPTQKDLFLIVVPSDDPANTDCNGEVSLLPADLLYPSTDPPASLRLGLTVHIINNSQAGPGQSITAKQNAIKMTENCATANPDVAGEAIPGIPSRNALSGAVFTHVIRDKINNVCQPGFACTDGFGNPTTADALITKHIINTFNHEMGHMFGLSVNVTRKVVNHWPVGTGNVLDQFVECTSNTRKQSASCDVPDIQGMPDIAGIRLYQ